MVEHFQDRTVDNHVFGLYGQVGVGKTQIALKFLQDNASSFHVRFWVYADTEHKISLSYDSFAAKLGCSSDGASREQTKQAVKDWLQLNPRWLIVFDNVEDLRLVKEYWPRNFSPDSLIVVTSRDAGIATRGGLLTGWEKVECFPEDTATKWFWSQIGHDGRDASQKTLAKQIVKKVGCLPLAINHMAAYIEGRGQDLQNFLDEFEEDDSIAVEQDISGANPSYEQNIATAWNLSLTQLSEHNAEASELLDLLSLLDPDRIPLELVLHSGKKDATVPAVLSNYGRQQRAVSNLEYKSLLEKFKTQPTLRVHRMTQTAVRNRWAAKPELEARAFRNATFCITEVYPKQIMGGSMVESYEDCAKFTEHLQRIFHYYQRHEPELHDPETFAEILAHCGWYFFERGDTESALNVLLAAEEICLKLSDAFNQTLGLIYNNLGAVCILRREESKGLVYTKKAIDHREATISKEDPEIQQLAMSYSNYANDMQYVHPFDKSEAKDYYKKALKICQECRGGTIQSQELVLSNMSFAFFRWGDLPRASKYISRAVDLHSQFEKDTTFMLYTLYYQGNIRWAMGFHEEGFNVHKDCLERRKALQGLSHYTTGVSLFKVGKLAYHLGLEEDAVEYLTQSEKTFQKYHDDPGLWPRSCLKLGKVNMAVGSKIGNMKMLEKGKEFWDKGLQRARDIKGDSFRGQDDEELDSLVREVYR